MFEDSETANDNHQLRPTKALRLRSKQQAELGRRFEPRTYPEGRAFRPYELPKWNRITGSSPRVTADLTVLARHTGKPFSLEAKRKFKIRDQFSSAEQRELGARLALRGERIIRERSKGKKGEYKPKQPRRLI